MAKAEVEKKQKALAKVQAKQQEFIDLKARLEKSLVTEGVIVDESPELAESYGDYAKQAVFSIERYQNEIERLEEMVEKAQEALKTAYAEQRKFEITLENRQNALKEEEKKREQKNLDEIASQGARRKVTKEVEG